MTQRTLIGVKAILNYLRSAHGLYICRDTLNRLRRAPKREFSCSGVQADAARFPASSSFNGLRVTVTADTVAIDAWVIEHRRGTRSADD